MNARTGLLIATLATGFCVTAEAAQIVEDFSSRSRLETEPPYTPTAVWNQALGKIHPSLRVMNFKIGFTPRDFDIGDGSDGAFELSTYARFSKNGDVSGNIIRLAHPELKVTRFVLEAGWKLEPEDNAPLIIRSLSDVRILGEIHCQGDDGGDAVGAVHGEGGKGRCGGADGGDGGAKADDGQPGNDGGDGATKGQGGTYTSGGPEVGGGGGGAHNQSSNAGPGSGGGAAGNTDDDPEFLNSSGGSGGGGGSGSDNAAGGGGGGGGGTVLIYAEGDVDLGEAPSSTHGFIYAGGGNGGSSDADGGPGGGGGGGSVLVFAGGTIHLYNDDALGASQAEPGLGGGNLNITPGVFGNGGTGRSWFTSVAYYRYGSAYYSPSEEDPPIIVDDNVEFDSTKQYVVTKPFDLRNSSPTIDGVTLSPASLDFGLEFAGSNDAFVSDDTGWTTALSDVQGKRYLRLRISVTTSDVKAPDMIDSVTIDYTPSRVDDFAFKAAGCARIDTPSPQPPTGFLLGLVLLILFFAGLRRGGVES